jgi:hypothetical protein
MSNMRTAYLKASRRILGAFVITSALMLCHSTVRANPILYQVTGTSTGTIGATAFTDASFALIGNADSTGEFQLSPGVFVNPLEGLSISLGGIGTVEALDAFYFYVNTSIPGGGFIDQAIGDVLDLGAPDFASYDGISPLGPISADELFLASFQTTGGVLSLSSADDLMFSVTQGAGTVPEPSTSGMLARVLVVLVVFVRRKTQGRRSTSCIHDQYSPRP